MDDRAQDSPDLTNVQSSLDRGHRKVSASIGGHQRYRMFHLIRLPARARSAATLCCPGCVPCPPGSSISTMGPCLLSKSTSTSTGLQGPGEDNRRVRRVQEPSELPAAQRLRLSPADRGAHGLPDLVRGPALQHRPAPAKVAGREAARSAAQASLSSLRDRARSAAGGRKPVGLAARRQLRTLMAQQNGAGGLAPCRGDGHVAGVWPAGGRAPPPITVRNRNSVSPAKDRCRIFAAGCDPGLASRRAQIS